MSRMRLFVRFVVVPLVMSAATLVGGNPAVAGDSAWTRVVVHAAPASQVTASAQSLVAPGDSAWT
ncbi:hypothetical protein GCM10009760_43990 [Kitasatospora kazusensis]|uniref:Uncharacterized protein n=1 Tax=Kitasatospora kazusensis TaxID=407974 RepID=A0ABN2ZY90_9ACTN